MTPKPAKLIEGSVGKHLVDMTVPTLFGIFMMMMQAFADAYFIGRVGDRELAALSFAFPILMIVTSVAIGLGAGTSSVVARFQGWLPPRKLVRIVEYRPDQLSTGIYLCLEFHFHALSATIYADRIITHRTKAFRFGQQLPR